MTHLEFVSNVFYALADNIVKTYTSDLFLDLPRTVGQLERGEDVSVLSRKTGSDRRARFECYEKDKYRDAYDYANRSLGWSVETILHPDFTVTVRMNNTCEFSERTGGKHINENGDLEYVYVHLLSGGKNISIMLSHIEYGQFIRDLRAFDIKVERLN